MTERELRYQQRKEEHQAVKLLENLYMAFAGKLVMHPLVGMHIRAGKDNPINAQTRKAIAEGIKMLNERTYQITLQFITKSWETGENLSFAQLPEKYRKLSKLPNKTALDAFIERKTKGIKLSKRVWNMKKNTQMFIETALQQGISEGKSAQGISQDLRQYLKNPDTYYRKVRNAKDELKLSRAAKKFNPGQGVYRSPYKNAVRLARNEINKAYRTAERQRYLNNPGVVGYKISLSNNHTLNGKPFVDMCDYLQGTYPKDFVWSGWHVQCRCKMTPILCSEEEFAKLTDTTRKKEYVPKQIKKPPSAMDKYLAENKDKLNPKATDWIDENKLIKTSD